MVALIAPVLTAPSLSSPAVADEAAGGTIAGTLVTQDTGLPISGAMVTLYRGDAIVATTTSDADGAYRFVSEPNGAYTIVVRAIGYQASRIEGVSALAGTTTTIRTPLLRAATGTSGNALREIGSTRVAGTRGNTLASTSTIQHDLSPDQLQAQGFLKAADALGQVPGVNLTGGPHTAGDDTFIDIRGMGQGEVRPLIDGHPVGPVGVFSSDYYDYANSPYFLLDNLQVTVGSGASGLYGVDVIGGTIDMQTLNPTRKPHADFYEGFGNQGLGISEAKVTGTIDKLGYALGHTVTGSYTDFQPGQIFQGARPNNNANLPNQGACLPGANPNGYPNVTSCNQALNTYSVSGNYRVQNDIAKLKYNFTDSTSLTLTAYAGNQLSDSTGNGDNDNLPYDTRLAEIVQTPSQCGKNGYFAVTNQSNNACLPAQTLAQVSYGPDGGGQDRNRGTTLQDYSARFTTSLGPSTFQANVYRTFYQYRKNSNQSSGLDPTGTFFVGGGTYSDDYLNDGILLSDDIAGQANDFGFGYFVEHQREFGNNFAYTAGPTPTSPGSGAFVPQAELGEGDYSFFVRDQYVPNSRFAAYLNAWSRRSSVTEKTTFDPRLSLVLHATRRDVVRLTGGRADGDPAESIKANGAFSNIGNPNSLNPSCSLLNNVASGGNPNLLAESANDYEAAYGHRFWSDTAINLVGYVSSEKNALFNGIQPITQYGPLALNNPVLVGEFAGYAAKIQAACPGLGPLNAQTVLPYLGITTTYNAASALYRGVELSGRIRFHPKFYTDFNYDIQSSQQTGIPVSILVNNPFLNNNTQIVGIPVHKGSVTFDFNDQRGVEVQLQGYYIAGNNTLNRQAYTFFNGFISKSIAKNLTVALSAQNLFGQAVQQYGYFGHQVYNPENAYQPAPNPAIAGFTPGVQQAATLGNGTQEELLGLSPTLVTFSLSARI